jgi:hypothetical protein
VSTAPRHVINTPAARAAGDDPRTVEAEQQDTSYLLEAVEAFRKEFFDVTGDRLSGTVVARALRAAESHFATHYEQKGAEGERNRIAEALVSDEAIQALYSYCPTLTTDNDAGSSIMEDLELVEALTEVRSAALGTLASQEGERGKVEVLEKALRFYADPRNYEDGDNEEVCGFGEEDVNDEVVWTADHGYVARNALGIQEQHAYGQFDEENIPGNVRKAILAALSEKETDQPQGHEDDPEFAFVGRCKDCGKLHSLIIASARTAPEISDAVLQMERDGLEGETMTVARSRTEVARCTSSETDQPGEESSRG